MLYKPILCVLWLFKHCLLTAFGPVSVSLAGAIPWRTDRALFSNTHFVSLSQVASLSLYSDCSQGLFLPAVKPFLFSGVGKAQVLLSAQAEVTVLRRTRHLWAWADSMVALCALGGARRNSHGQLYTPDF